MSSKNIVVVGAGIAGMAAAYELQKRGHVVEVYEASGQYGGRGQLLQRPGTEDWADVGTQYFHSNYVRALSLIDELGLSEELKTISGKSRVFESEKSSFLMSPSIPWVKPAGVLGNLAALIYVLKLVVAKKLDAYSHSAQPGWDNIAALDSTKNQSVRDYIIRTLVLVGGLNEPECSDVSVLQVVRLIRIILMTDYVSLKNGTASLHQALASRLKVQLNTPIKRLLIDDATHQVCGIQTSHDVKIYADHVVLATPAPVTATLLPNHWKAERNYLEAIDMPPAIIVSLFLDRPLEDGVWTYFMPVTERSNVRFCVDAHQKNPQNTPSGKSTLQAWVLSPESEALIGKPDDVVIQAIIEDVSRYFPDIQNWVQGHLITRHAMAVPQSRVGHNTATKDFLERVETRDNVSFCGDYLSGGYLECALWSVERALENIPSSE